MSADTALAAADRVVRCIEHSGASQAPFPRSGEDVPWA